MEFPLPLRTAIEQKAQDSSTAELIREAQGLSQRYREESGQGKRLSPPTAGVCLTPLCGCPLPLAR